mgnify:FL=1
MKKKMVFRNYGYRECDSFAAYLEKMASKGWIFKGWRFGMIFEKEAPRKEIYDVEVFPEGDENDVKPEPNTKEYAQYCREAGWELIDSTRKLCVFRKIREDALPIVTERERYENIREAEWKAFRGRLAYTCFMAVSEWYALLNTDFARNIFSDIWIAVFILWNLYFLENAARCVSYLFWKSRAKKMLEQGKTPFYGSRIKEISPWKTIQKIISYVVFLGIIAIVLFLADSGTMQMYLVFIVGMILMLVLLPALRPSREWHMLLQVIFAFLIIFIGFSALMVNMAEDSPAAKENIQVIENTYGTGELEFTDELKGIFGSARRYSLLLPDGYPRTDDPYDENEIICQVYQSPYQWILDRIYSLYTKEEGEIPPDAEAWEAIETEQNRNKNYTTVKYGDRLLYIIGKKNLDKEEILFIRQALGL